MTEYTVDIKWLWATTRYLNHAGNIAGRAYLFMRLGWDAGV